MPELARTCRLATGFILAGLISVVADGQDRSYDRDGVFRYDIIDMTSREVSVADARQIHYGSYRAYFRVFPFGTGPAGFYEEREPHKDFRLMHTVPDLVGKYRDRSVDYTEGWEGPDKLVVTHSSPGPGKIRRTRRILTRVETETTEWDGAWRLRVVDETASEELSGERVWIRYGDYVGFFWRAPDRLLYAIYAKQTEKNRFRILFSTREEEVGTILDHASEYQGGWDGVRWVESYVEAWREKVCYISARKLSKQNQQRQRGNRAARPSINKSLSTSASKRRHSVPSVRGHEAHGHHPACSHDGVVWL